MIVSGMRVCLYVHACLYVALIHVCGKHNVTCLLSQLSPLLVPICRQTLKERLTYLVPSSVHFMDETFMNEIVEDAVNHLINTGLCALLTIHDCSTILSIQAHWFIITHRH